MHAPATAGRALRGIASRRWPSVSAALRCEVMADWIFEANPRHYDLAAAVATSRQQWWGTPHFRDQMAVGDRVWLQVVGPKDPGIYYIATITSPTYEHSVEPSDPRHFRWRTDIRFDYRVDPPLLRTELVGDPELGSFRPFRGFEGSNVPVPADIASALAARTASRLDPLGLLERLGLLQPGAQEAELVAFRVGQDVPAFRAGLADVGGPGAKSEQPLELGLLVPVSRVDVDVQPELPGLRVAARAEDEGGLQPAEAGVRRPDLDASVVFAAEFDVAENLAPECGQPLGVGAVDDQLTDAVCHIRQSTEPPFRTA
jgi:hypothetical protein